MLCAFASAVWGLSKLRDCDEDTKGKLAIFCIADAVLAVIHGLMAYYMQRQIVHGLGGKEYSQMSAKEIQAESGRILLYDVPVCLYFFLANAAFALNAWSLTIGWGDCAGSQSQPHLSAAVLMLVWGMCAGAYLVCWYCCQSCQGAASSTKKPSRGSRAGPPAAVGAPAVAPGQAQVVIISTYEEGAR